jgi:hypothetical protein
MARDHFAKILKEKRYDSAHKQEYPDVRFEYSEDLSAFDITIYVQSGIESANLNCKTCSCAFYTLVTFLT